MKTFKAIIAAITLLAVAANPIVAMAMPCCCTKPVEQQRSCCQPAAQKTSSNDQHACCAKHQASNKFVEQRAGCCCITSSPASTSPRESLAKLSVENHSFDVAFWSADQSLQAPTSRYLDHSADRFSVSGPPLLALYCIWLK